MKILFITQYFYPDIQATSKVFTELCEDLAGAGHGIDVVCSKPFLTAGTSLGKKLPKIHKEIRIKRPMLLPAGHKRNLFARFWGHFFYTLYASIKVLFERKHNLIVFTSDNPFNFIPAFFAGRAPKVYLCQDLYLEMALASGIIRHGFVAKIHGALQDASYRLADAIVTIGRAMAEHLVSLGVARRKISVISNWVDIKKIVPQEQKNEFSKRIGLAEKFVCLHAGRIGLTQDIKLILNCADHLRNEEHIHFLIIGGGAGKERSVEHANSLAPTNTTFLEYQTEEILNDVLATAGVGVITSIAKLSHSLVPSRLYSFMASGRPIIATAEPGDTVHDIIQAAQCGFCIRHGDLNGFKKALLELRAQPQKRKKMGENGRRFVQEEFSRESKTREYMTLFNQIAQRFSGRRT